MGRGECIHTTTLMQKIVRHDAMKCQCCSKYNYNLYDFRIWSPQSPNLVPALLLGISSKGKKEKGSLHVS